MKIITVEHLSKYYTIGHDRNSGVIRYKTFRESMMSAGRSLYQRLRHPLSPNREQVELEEFRALDDVSFEVEQGDRIGIIGRNGAGKSTLLKLLCRITEPTKGRITMRGRVASLLEVGTGFHPELSGRENIYLNGAILGMKRAEIKRKFDEIVAFSGVEKFLDTPVKRYSSGMYVRLAFAVAAHLESEILLIDEVLAVGDAEFQKKCLGKMDDISKNEGRTILFVSHNMGAIKKLCNKGILLKKGKLCSADYCITNIMTEYALDQLNIKFSDLSNVCRFGSTSGALRFQQLQFCNNAEKETQPISGAPLIIRVFYSCQNQYLKNVRFSIAINQLDGNPITILNNVIPSVLLDLTKKNFFEYYLEKMPLAPGTYYMTLFAEINGDIADWIREIPFQIQESNFSNTETNIPSNYPAVVLLDYKWKLKSIS